MEGGRGKVQPREIRDKGSVGKGTGEEGAETPRGGGGGGRPEEREGRTCWAKGGREGAKEG